MLTEILNEFITKEGDLYERLYIDSFYDYDFL